MLLVGVPRGGPPPERQVCLSSIIAPRMAMKSKAFETVDEPFAWDSREFLRKLVIGKPVAYTIEYEDRGKEFASVQLENKQDLGLTMVESGLAKVIGSHAKGTATTGVAKNIAALKAAEAKAKDQKLGLWTDDALKLHQAVRQIQWISNDTSATKAFATRYHSQQLPAVIEFIRDAGAYRVYIVTEGVQASVLLSGVQADAFRRSPDGGTGEALQADPYAVEAKYFASQRVLNRDVLLRVEGADDFGNLYGSFIHPNGNISALLVRNGFAKVHDRTVNFTLKPMELREAQREAQRNRVRKWCDYEPQTLDTDRTEYFARVVEVVSGDSLIIMDVDNTADGDPSLIQERRVYLASIRCPRPATRTRPEEPWAFEAKELVRKKLIGKRVKVVVSYTRTPTLASGAIGNLPPASDSAGRMHFVSITYDNGKSNIAETLVSQGLATVLPDRSEDPVAANYDTLVTKAAEATSKMLGLHSSSPPPRHRFNDLSGHTNANIAKCFGESLKRAEKLEGVIEHVTNGSRFKVRIPSESALISFALAGIRAPSTSRRVLNKASVEGEEFGDEALQYSRLHFLQRPVEIKIETCDRGGTFIGLAWCNKDCINVQLVSQGLAEVHDRGAAGIRKELEAAQTTAADQCLGIWSVKSLADNLSRQDLSDSFHDSVLGENGNDGTSQFPKVLPAVAVVHSTDVNDMFIQCSPCPEVDRLQEELGRYIAIHRKSLEFPRTNPPKQGDTILAQFSEDKQWYRGRVEKVHSKTSEALVRYTDFGNSETLSLYSLLKCPAEYSPSKIRPFAQRCTLAGVKPPIDLEAEGADALVQLTDGRVYRCVIERVDSAAHRNVVQLYPLKAASTDAPNGTASSSSTDPLDKVHPISLNEALVMNGLAIVDTHSPTSIMDALKAAEARARKARLNVWQHGDVDGYESDHEIRRQHGHRSNK